MTLFSRTDTSSFGEWWWTVDRALLVAFFVLMGFGVVLVASAGAPVAGRIGYDEFHFIKRHLMILGPSVALMLGISFLDPKTVRRLAVVTLAVGIAGMAAALGFGSEVKGAQRWIPFFGFSLQPSEFVKPAFAVVAAWLLARQKEVPEFPAHKICGAIFLVVVALLLLQPDLGMTIVVTAVLAAQIFLAGLPFRYLVLFGIGGVVFIVAAYFGFGHVQSRIDRFLDPAAGDNYQIERALEAFGNGGFLGTGPGQGNVKLTIPDAHSDFAFSVVGEEQGFIFLAVLIGIYAFIILRGMGRMTASGDMFSILAGGGLLVMFGLQALIHMGSNVHILPTKGMTLPFVSYGGSSLLSSAFAMGMVLALSRRQARAAVARGGLVMRGAAVAADKGG